MRSRCLEDMTPLILQVYQLIEIGLQDHDAGMQRATGTAVGCLYGWMKDECNKNSAALLPAIMILVPIQRCRARLAQR